MNTLDVLFLIIITFFTILGIYWGLIHQVLAVVGLLVGIVMAGRFSGVVAAWLSSFVADEALAGALGFILVVAGVSVIASFVASVLRLFVGLLLLKPVDHLAGGILGLLQGVLTSAVVIVALVTFPVPTWAQALESSQLVEPLLRISGPITLLLPEVFDFAMHAVLDG